MPNDWKETIFREKSLWQVYSLSRRTLPKPRSNRIIFWLFAGVFFIFAVWGLYARGENYTSQDALKLLRFTAEQGLSLSIGILGFLIAGFAIFASVTRAELFITLANISYRGTSINRLQFVFFNFINVFTVYIGLLTISLLLTISAADGSPVLRLGGMIASHCPRIAYFALLIMLCILGLWIVSALLKLKSFIWNLYQTVLVAIATESELQDRERQQKQQ